MADLLSNPSDISRGNTLAADFKQLMLNAGGQVTPTADTGADTRDARVRQYVTDNQGFTGNFVDKVMKSHQQAMDLAPLVGDALVIDGKVNSKFYQQSATYLTKQAQATTTLEEKKLETDITSGLKKWNDSSDMGGKLSAGWDILSNTLSNPKGLAYLGAESAASITAMLLGAKSGALIAGGAALATGGAAAPAAPFIVAAGTIAASTAHSGTQEFMNGLKQKLDENKIPYDPTQIKTFMESNPDIIEALQQKSLKYGAAMGVVDAALGGVGGKLATMPERAALRSARTAVSDVTVKAALADIAKETGRTLEDITTQTINRQAKELLAETSFKSKLGHKALNYGVEVASEPASEAAASIAAGKEVTAKDLIYETLGGIGAGPYGAAVNKAVFGTTIATDQTKDFIKKMAASTPESRAAASEQKAEIKDAKVQRQAPADLNFKRDVADTDPADPKVDAWADPAHKSYDPIKAVTILAKVEDPDTDHVDRARKVQNDFRASIAGMIDKRAALQEEQMNLVKNKEESKALQVQDQITKMDSLIEQKTGTYNQVAEQVTKIKNMATMSAQSRVVNPIDPETATPDQVTEHITSSLGSHGNKNAVTNDGIATLMKRTDLSDDQRTMLGALTAANVARKSINDRATNGKSMDEVSNDIYNGLANSDFKGVDAYRQGIMNHLQEERVVEAEKQFAGLKKFRDVHQAKSENVKSIFDTIMADKPLTPEQKITYDAMKRENPNFYINKRSSNLVANIHSEAAALNAEVTLAESLLAVHKNKGKATIPAATSSASTANPAASVVEPVSVTPVAPKLIPESTPAMTSNPEAKPAVTDDLDIDYSALSDDALQRFADKAEVTGVENLTPEQAIKFKAVNKEIAQRHERNAPAKDIEINESTDKEIPDSLGGNSIESLNDLTVTYIDTDGSEVTKPYSEASQELDTEIQEAEDILKCFKSK